MDLRSWLRAQWDRVAAIGLSLAGLVALVLGWYGVSGEKLPAGQIPYVVSGGLAGVVLIGLGATAWLSADLRDEWRKLDRLETVGLELLEQAHAAERQSDQHTAVGSAGGLNAGSAIIAVPNANDLNEPPHGRGQTRAGTGSGLASRPEASRDG